MACKYYGSCKHQSGWCKSDSMLIKCVYGLNEQCTEQSWKIEALETENKELKRLLELAVEDLSKYRDYADIGIVSRACLCKSCKTRCVTNRICEKCNYEYINADEALKLIGGKNET